MRVTVDTNLLVRIFTADDIDQNQAANRALDEADAAVLTLPMLCELVWVLRRGYRVEPQAIIDLLRGLMETRNAVFDRAAIEAGIAALGVGGDFADGVIAHEGRKLGGDEFLSFDRKAVQALQAKGERARLLT